MCLHAANTQWRRLHLTGACVRTEIWPRRTFDRRAAERPFVCSALSQVSPVHCMARAECVCVLHYIPFPCSVNGAVREVRCQAHPRSRPINLFSLIIIAPAHILMTLVRRACAALHYKCLSMLSVPNQF